MTNKLHDVQNAIITALEAITTDGSAYNFDINQVNYGLPDTDEIVGGRAEMFLTEIAEEVISTSGNIDVQRATYTVVGMLQTDMQQARGNFGTDTMKLAADIQKALTTDQTLGGVVYQTQKQSTSVVYFNKGAKAYVTMVFFSDYPVTIGSP